MVKLNLFESNKHLELDRIQIHKFEIYWYFEIVSWRFAVKGLFSFQPTDVKFKNVLLSTQAPFQWDPNAELRIL